MDLKKVMDIRSPLGLVVVGAAVLALSPQVRRTGRRLLVKGTAASLDLADRMREWKDRRGEGEGVELDLSAFGFPADNERAEETTGDDSRQEEKEVNPPDDSNETTHMIQSLKERIEQQQQEIDRLRREMAHQPENPDQKD
ncbi:hypothetical protein C8P63_11189 [Melghirimyces profundicolus]|uniref:Uncharacterized protein n=1 Tax=Melghirimyces profundicolus TaxID=1242148 RepID=A0A2T6BUC3_9BACL|nr:hypothetical protein [Melghirimyces profundicolus]PTX59654.1 hypothetical protein C8P63_11189 [Melghirimyces profundicolus]